MINVKYRLGSISNASIGTPNEYKLSLDMLDNLIGSLVKHKRFSDESTSMLSSRVSSSGIPQSDINLFKSFSIYSNSNVLLAIIIISNNKLGELLYIDCYPFSSNTKAGEIDSISIKNKFLLFSIIYILVMKEYQDGRIPVHIDLIGYFSSVIGIVKYADNKIIYSTSQQDSIAIKTVLEYAIEENLTIESI